MKFRIFKILIAILYLCVLQTKSFAQDSKEIVGKAETYASQGLYKEALDLLGKYNKKNPNDKEVIRLELKLLHWDKQDAKAEKAYISFIAKYPDYMPLKLDYAGFLYENGRLKAAKDSLHTYLYRDSLQSDALYQIATIYFAEGKVNHALGYATRLYASRPEDMRAKALYESLKEFTAPQYTLYSGYYSDQQPLKKYTNALHFSMHRSVLVAPSIHLLQQRILQEQSLAGVELGNTIHLSNRLAIYTQAGALYISSWEKKRLFTGLANAKLKVTGNLLWETELEKKPGIYTLSSVQNPVVENRFLSRLTWGNSAPSYSKADYSFKRLSNWNAQAGYVLQHFQDGNNIQTAYGWLLTPRMRVGKGDLRIGYAYSYANSQQSTFNPQSSLSEILANWKPEASIEGEYNLYFTPMQQQVHTLLSSLNYLIHKKIDIQLKYNVALHAQARAPYLFLDKEQGVTLLKRGSYLQTYHPVELNIGATYKIDRKVSIGAGYRYSKTFFFNYHQLDLKINYKLIHD